MQQYDSNTTTTLGAIPRISNLPPTDFQPVLSHWRQSAVKLAEWTMTHLVNRSDCYGKYWNIGPDANNCKEQKPLSTSFLSRHFFGGDYRVGVYSYDQSGNGRWICIDIDAHEEAIEENWLAVCKILAILEIWGINALVEHTNGRYGFHLWIIFDEKVPCGVLRSIGLYLTRGISCEVFPKQSHPSEFGNYVRLPGRHHKNVNWHSDFYHVRRDVWLAGNQAFEYLFKYKPAKLDDVPDEAKTFTVQAKIAEFSIDRQSDGEWSEYQGDLSTLDIVKLSKDRLTGINSGNSYGVVCPWISEHTTGDSGTCVFENDGWPSFDCLHSHCQDRNLSDYLATFTPDEVDACCSKIFACGPCCDDEVLETYSMDDPYAVDLSTTPDPNRSDPKAYSFRPIDSRTLKNTVYTREWLVHGVLVNKQPCIFGGPKKSLKTNTLIDLSISLGTGTPFLNHFKVRPATVALISGESGEATIQETALRVCSSKGVDLADANVFWDFRLPKLAVEDELKALSEGLAHNRIEVAIIDPIYLCLLSGSDKQAQNVFDMGPLLLEVAKACLDAGCMPILAHHARKTGNGSYKNPYQPLDLEDLAFAGIQEFARQWLLINRRKEYMPGSGSHSMWLSSGGSVGHGGLWGVDIDEGELLDDFSGRKWDVKVLTTTEVRRQANLEKEYKAEAKDEAACESLLEIVRNGEITKTALRERLGWRHDKFSRIVATLVQGDTIQLVAKEIHVGNGGKRKAEMVTLGT